MSVHRLSTVGQINKIREPQNKNDPKAALDALKNVLNEQFGKCQSLDDIEQCKRAFLLTIKKTQEKSNHNESSCFHPDPKEDHYGEITKKGTEILWSMKMENTQNFKLLCQHDSSSYLSRQFKNSMIK